jgi:hypothetical protein
MAKAQKGLCQTKYIKSTTTGSYTFSGFAGRQENGVLQMLEIEVQSSFPSPPHEQ